MSNIEHYFENMLFYGEDTTDNPNKNALTKEEQNAVEECASYVLYTLFYGRAHLIEFALGNIYGRKESEDISNSGVGQKGHWVFRAQGVSCSICGAKAPDVTGLPSTCQVCGAKMY